MDIPLPQLKRQLEEMLLDLQHLVTALQRLRDMLPEHSQKRVTVMTMLGRLNDANKKALRNTISDTDLQIEYNAIRADLLDFVQRLEEEDFDLSAAAAEALAAKGAKNGSVLYRIPHTMPLREETQCVVRIALDEDAIVEEITLDKQVVLKSLTRVSDLMQVELGDPAKEPVFTIRSTSPLQQLITDEGFTEWFFYVEPNRIGVHPLEVKVSVLEMAFNQIHRKEIVFRETIQIITEALETAGDSDKDLPPSQESDSGFKHAGQALAFGATAAIPDIEVAGFEKGLEAMPEMEASPEPSRPAKPSTIYVPKPSKSAKPSTIYVPSPPAPVVAVDGPPSRNSGARTLALFMAFILLGSSATWALTPSATRDWWIASIIKDDAAAYTAYVEKHPDSPYLEKALFYRAERSNRLAYLRDYQEKYPEGKYQATVATRIYRMESVAIEKIRLNPNRENIRQFVADYPETNRLGTVKQAVESRSENRAELLAEVEDGYIITARTKPTAQKITDYLRDFPEQDRLDEVAEAAATKPEVMAKVQPELEEAYLRKMEQNLTPAKAERFLDQFPEPIRKKEFEKILEKRPAVQQTATTRMQRLEDRRNLREMNN